MKRALFSIAGISLGLVAWIVTSACNQQRIQTPVRSFDRPTDVALTCAEYRPQDGLYDVHPVSECNPNNLVDIPDAGALPVQPFLGPNPRYQFLMALVTQSARGEVALVDANRNKLVSLQPKLPGFGFLPVGLLPEHIRTTPDGCTAVTSNTDSCDYGVIDVATMINGVSPPVDGGPRTVPGQTNVVRRIVASVPDGNGGARTLPARPRWIEIAPDSPMATHGYEPGGTAGQCTNGAPKAWAALPNCELLVKLDLTVDSGRDPQHPTAATVVQAIKVTKTGTQVVTDLSTLSCPSECSGLGPADAGGTGDLMPAPRDMTTHDLAGSPPPPLVNTTQAFPGTLAVDGDGGRLIIGDLYGERIDIIPVDKSGKLGTPRKVQLEAGAAGVTVVRVSPRTYAGQFVYAIARDGSVRVVDLDREVECETNPDPRYSGNGVNLQDPAPPADPTPQARQLGCFPLGDPATPPRAWFATSPGITLNQGQLPKDVAFVHVELPPGVIGSSSPPPNAAPGTLVGDFAWILSSDGRGTIVDIFDACPQPNQQDLNNQTGPFTPQCSLGNVPLSRSQTLQLFGHPTPLLLDRLAHRLRSGHQRFGKPQSASDPTGMPRIVDEFNPFTVAVPSSTTVAADAGVATGDAGASPNLPGLYQDPLPLSLTQTYDTAPTRVIKFVDPDRARTELWSLAWEGLLPATGRTLGQPLPHGYLSDNGAAWCTHGVTAGDKLVYSGCTQDGDCDYMMTATNGKTGLGTCVHDPAAPSDVLNGLCLPLQDPTLTVDYWSRVCGKLLRAQRKFRVVSARVHQPLPDGVAPTSAGSPPQPTDFVKLAEIYEPEYTQQTTTCVTDADCTMVTIAPTSGPAGNLATRCLGDYDGVKRCLLGCDPAAGDDSGAAQPRCGADFQCAKSSLGDLRCLRAPLDDKLFAQCFLELQPYEIHAGNSFVVAGTSSGFGVYEQPDANGECTVPPLTSEFARLRQSRVPLAPADNCTLVPTAGETTPSPLDSIDHTVLHNNVCVVQPAAGQITQSRLIHFENGVFNIAVTVPVDSDGKVIVPPDGTALGFNLTGGGTPLSAPLGVDVQAENPSFVTVAPDHQTVYIVDAGKTAVAAGLRGQLLRLFTPTQTVDHVFVIR